MNRTAFAPARLDGSTGFPVFLAAVAAVALVLVPFPQNVYLVAVGAAFVVAAVRPPVMLGCLVASVPVQTIGEEHVWLVNLTLTKTVLAVLFAAASWWFWRVLTHRIAVRLDRVVAAYVAYLAVLALSIVNATDIVSWASELYRWFVPLLVYVIAINMMAETRDGRPIVVGTATGVAAASVYGFVQVAAGLGPEAFSVGGWTRAYATFGQPNPFAGYLGLTVPLLAALSAAWLLPSARPALRSTFGGPIAAAAAVAAVLGAAALILTQSRGGWLGALAGLGVVAILLGGRVRWVAITVGVTALGMVALTPHGGRLMDRFASGIGFESESVQVTPQNFAVQERLAHMRTGWAMAERYPVVGVGGGNFGARYREFAQVWRFRISRGHAHNAYIHAAAQTGFVGLALYGVLIGVVAFRLRSWLLTAADPATRAIAVGAIGVSLAFAVHNLFDYLHVLSLPVQLTLTWALASAGARSGPGSAAATSSGYGRDDLTSGQSLVRPE